MLSHTTQPTYFSIPVCIKASMGIIKNTFRLTRLEEKNLLKGLKQWFQVAEGIKNFQLEEENKDKDSESLEKIKNEVAGYLPSDVIAYFMAHLKRRCDQLKNTNCLFSDEMDIDRLIIPTLLVAIKIADDNMIWNEDWYNIAMKIADDSSIYGVKNIQSLHDFELEHLSALEWTLSVTFQEMKDIFSTYFPPKEEGNYQYVLDSLERVSTVPADDEDEEIIEEVDEETEKKQSDNVDNGYTESSEGSRRSSPARPLLDEYPQSRGQSVQSTSEQPTQSIPKQPTCGFFAASSTNKEPSTNQSPSPICNIASIDTVKKENPSLVVSDNNKQHKRVHFKWPKHCSII